MPSYFKAVESPMEMAKGCHLVLRLATNGSTQSCWVTKCYSAFWQTLEKQYGFILLAGAGGSYETVVITHQENILFAKCCLSKSPPLTKRGWIIITYFWYYYCLRHVPSTKRVWKRYKAWNKVCHAISYHANSTTLLDKPFIIHT